jgi:triacylglycerol lipase
MIERLIDDGWPPEYLVGFNAMDPAAGCNIDNAAAIAALVDSVLLSTGQSRVDIVAHSMGTLSSRYYIKNLGGQEVVNTYVTLGGMHHGLGSPCLSPEGMQCTWDELCGDRAYLTQLNEPPATPGQLYWVSIYGTEDATVPNDSSHLEGAENISLPGVAHSGTSGLEQHPDAYAEILRVLQYPCW